jgi:hypothetical protein
MITRYSAKGLSSTDAIKKLYSRLEELRRDSRFKPHKLSYEEGRLHVEIGGAGFVIEEFRELYIKISESANMKRCVKRRLENLLGTKVIAGKGR